MLQNKSWKSKGWNKWKGETKKTRSKVSLCPYILDFIWVVILFLYGLISTFLLSNLSLFSPYFFLFSPYLIRSSVALKSSSYIILYHDMCQIKIDLEHVSWYDSILVKGNLINVFGQTVVTVTFQSAFHPEIYQNNIFFIF